MGKEEKGRSGVWQLEHLGIIGEILHILNRIYNKHIEQRQPVKMSQQTSGIFTSFLSRPAQLIQELSHPLLRNIFTINGNEILLLLTDHYLVIADVLTQKFTHYCELVFEIKFECFKKNDDIQHSIKLEKEKCAELLQFHNPNPAIVQQWALVLEKKINQRNFHKLFKAKKKIGKGAFATVYLAQRIRDNKLIAIKAFSKEKQYSSDKGKDSLKNEIDIMRNLDHPNVMKLEGVYETQNSIYVILEYLQGIHLNDMMKRQKLNDDQKTEILRNLLRGLSHLSRHNIIHRDLKPQNIMFRDDTTMDLAICDFGLATVANSDNYLFVRCGTPGFVAPEIINIKDMSTKSQPISDVFSIGIIFHCLLFGCSIFPGKKYNEILAQNRICEFNWTNPMYGNVPPKTLELLMKMLEVNPKKRISADDCLRQYFGEGMMDIEEHQKLKDVANTLNQRNILSQQQCFIR